MNLIWFLQVIQHGACLGLGLAAMGTADEEIYEDVKNVLNSDSAVAGEAAGISMGLLMVGTSSRKAGEMLAYAHDTQHEKIIRWVRGDDKFLLNEYPSSWTKNSRYSLHLLFDLQGPGARSGADGVRKRRRGGHSDRADDERSGSDSPVRRDVRDCAGLQRDIQQQGDSPAAALRCLRRQ